MAIDLLLPDTRSEAYKGGIHLALFALASVCAAYNAGAAVVRPSGKLRTQAALYGALAAWEATQVYRHWAGD